MAVENQSITSYQTESSQSTGQESTYRLPEDQLLVSRSSNQQPHLSVILPTLNEVDGIGECIDQIQVAFKELGVFGEIIVSDSSTDGTPKVARELGAIVVTPEEEGYGAAYQHGFNFARGEYVAIGDADTTYDFTELPKLYRLVADGEADIAMGSRLQGQINPGAMPALHRYIGNPLLTSFLNIFYNADVSDAHSGLRVFSRDTLQELKLESVGMEFASEMVMKASAAGLTIEERPITYHERTGDATLNSFRDGWRHIRFMLMNAPSYLFSVPAVLFLSSGVTMLSLPLVWYSLLGDSLSTQLVIAGSLLLVVGCQVGCLGLFSSIATDPIQNSSGPVTLALRDRFRLEHGATAGVVFIFIGISYSVGVFGRWIVSNHAIAPPTAYNLVAFTVVVFGVQIVFNSFFMSMLAKHSRSE